MSEGVAARETAVSDLIAGRGLAAVIALLVRGILAAAGGAGRRKGGGFQVMAAMLLGFGAPLDPPQHRVVEARDGMKKGSPETGEPEIDD